MTCSHNCLLCYHKVCLFMTWSQVKLTINLSFRNDCWSGFLSSQYQLWHRLSMIDPPNVLKNELVQLHFDFGHWQDNITGWELKVSVRLKYSWKSTSVLPGYRLGTVVVVPLENQLNILIFQCCCHVTFHMIYEWLNCVISRPVYSPKHNLATNYCDTQWLAKGFLPCRIYH